MCPNYTWYSPQSDNYIEVSTTIALRDIPPNEHPHDWERVLEMPASLRRTYLDGQRKDLTDFKQIARINKDMADLRSDDPRRAEMKQEIRQRKRINKKG